MLIQVYEITNPDEAQQIAAADVNHVGVLVGNGEFPREIRIEKAAKILEAIQDVARNVVLTLSSDPAVIRYIAEQLQPDILHLGTLPGSISHTEVRELKRRFPQIKIMRSIPVIGEKSIGMAKQYEGIADFLLLDTHKEDDNQVGATGRTHDWNISRKIVESVKTPVILAGGLGPENVAEAIRRVQPAGVDSKTRTDQDGGHHKDIERVRRFVETVRLIG